MRWTQMFKGIPSPLKKYLPLTWCQLSELLATSVNNSKPTCNGGITWPIISYFHADKDAQKVPKIDFGDN